MNAVLVENLDMMKDLLVRMFVVNSKVLDHNSEIILNKLPTKDVDVDKCVDKLVDMTQEEWLISSIYNET